MTVEQELWQTQRQLRELVVAMGRQEARCGELGAEIAIVRAESDLLREANGCLQERLAKLEAGHAALKEDFRKHYTYEQTGRT